MYYSNGSFVIIVKIRVNIVYLLVNFYAQNLNMASLPQNYPLFRRIRACGFTVEAESIEPVVIFEHNYENDWFVGYGIQICYCGFKCHAKTESAKEVAG